MLGKSSLHPRLPGHGASVGQLPPRVLSKALLYVSVALLSTGHIPYPVAQNTSIIIVGWVLQGLSRGRIGQLVSVILVDVTTLDERSKLPGFMAIPAVVDNITSVGGILIPHKSSTQRPKLRRWEPALLSSST
ncbi:hypothetical protein F4779DRAFT_609913 [Xylariaceae sp. FL0662B]|nr:hypothetical protein F4779DRAFT_609913 [Xylariaceae sp. FL0662B]